MKFHLFLSLTFCERVAFSKSDVRLLLFIVVYFGSRKKFHVKYLTEENSKIKYNPVKKPTERKTHASDTIILYI